ncbi:hypothetical protein GUITHDRAFT_132619 [Guillardia theta CCMP2712]|uniref:Uncharacterized protein n=2 Tax=Guillardia theta TaxID=55529 RepID=L1K1A7_GUITC|nr:hypothetical protein GUITHDRAFT_132619 [Guillardia theta CCMP2712]EKX54235.1 hypothetical protein GUITHDRAFT_132619 [Guillardia theta CCMP2712]|eukprot:XP_005841215.1 hypothetical protein GUITHDRAFT_132619 [Guillardia theta CCMP2712]
MATSRHRRYERREEEHHGVKDMCSSGGFLSVMPCALVLFLSSLATAGASAHSPLAIADGLNLLGADGLSLLGGNDPDLKKLQTDMVKNVFKQLETREDSVEEKVEKAWRVIARRGNCELSDLYDSLFLESNPVTRVYIDAHGGIGLQDASKIMFASHISRRDGGEFVLVCNVGDSSEKGAKREKLNRITAACSRLNCPPDRVCDMDDFHEVCVKLCESAVEQGIAYLECTDRACQESDAGSRFQRFVSERSSCCQALRFRSTDGECSDPKVLMKQGGRSWGSVVEAMPLLALSAIDLMMGTFRVLCSDREASFDVVYQQLMSVVRGLNGTQAQENQTRADCSSKPIFFPVLPFVYRSKYSSASLSFDVFELLDRGMCAEGFKCFASHMYLKADTSHSQLLFDESDLWKPNFDYLTKRIPKLRAIRQEAHGVVIVRNYDEVIPYSLPLSEPVPLTSMNETGGTKQLVRPRMMWMNEFDIESMKEEDYVYLKDWGVFKVVRMDYDDESQVRALMDFSFEEYLDHELKDFLWVRGCPQDSANGDDQLVELDFIFRRMRRSSASKTEEEETRMRGWGESEFKRLEVGTFVFIEGMGLFFVSSKSKQMDNSISQELIELASVPSGKAISVR